MMPALWHGKCRSTLIRSPSWGCPERRSGLSSGSRGSLTKQTLLFCVRNQTLFCHPEIPPSSARAKRRWCGRPKTAFNSAVSALIIFYTMCVTAYTVPIYTSLLGRRTKDDGQTHELLKLQIKRSVYCCAKLDFCMGDMMHQ